MARQAGKPAMLLVSMSSRASQKRVFTLFVLSASRRNKQKCKITCNITILYLFLQNKNDYEIFNFILHLVYNYQLFFYSKG